MNSEHFHRRALLAAGATAPFALLAANADDTVLKAEAERVAVAAKVIPAVCCVCSYGGGGVGSGVVIDPEGYALTNYHVTETISPVMQVGLSDGRLYEAVIVGQDKVGDVALIKLLPREAGKPFAFAKLGDSDKVRAGDWSFAMGNPFGLSLDFTPTVTYGLVSGVNRYQPPEGKGTLEYTDCIQIDTSINPGNSGGPLFNDKGELIGINGRGSFEKRGRVNSGVGYAISINQIKNFLGHLYAGLDTDHATLGAAVGSESEDGDLAKMVIKQVLEESDAFRREIQPGDQVISFAGRNLTSNNHYKNILGIFPKEWRLPIVYRRNNVRKESLVRLMGNMDKPVGEDAEQPKPPGPARPQRKDPNAEKAKQSPAMKLFKEKKGFANFHFNEEARNKLLAELTKAVDGSKALGMWSLLGSYDRGDRKGEFQLLAREDDKSQTDITLKFGDVIEKLIPLQGDNNLSQLKLPLGSGGLMLAFYHYRRLLQLGAKGFELGCDHGGWEPFYPPKAGVMPTENLQELRVDCEVLRTRHAAIDSKWYFSKADKSLIGFETYTAKDEDPCEVYFSDYRAVDGKRLPYRMDVYYGGKRYGTFTVSAFKLDPK